MADYTRPHERATPQEVWAILRQLAESRKETDRRLRKLDELFTGQWGKLVEGDLSTLLNRRGIRVDHTVSNPRKEHGARRWEIDILAVNGDQVVVVEVKTTLKVSHVDHLLGLLPEFTELMPEYGSRRIHGAVAYLKADESSARYAERQGLFVIRATGGSASIVNHEDFTPRRFDRQSRHSTPS